MHQHRHAATAEYRHQMMELFNTLTKTKERVTASDNHVRIYSCGPTVYDRAHIGNLASFIYADFLSRVLRADGYEVTHVMNLTDVDDKTIARSKMEFPNIEPMEALRKLTRHYEVLFLADLKKIGIATDTITFARATDYIDEMQHMIRGLAASGYAYLADDGIYFSIETYKKSGKTYGQLVDITASSTGSARVNNDEYDKDNIHDFALWKQQKPGEPAWGFEINGTDMTGRPGWHIECSAMSKATLGAPFDIHTGGIDLKFPHHENEIAQSTALTDSGIFAHHFMHSEHILVNGKKMSKSLGNYFTLDDIEHGGVDPAAFRLLVLEGHYRNQRNYSRDSLEAASNRLKHWKQSAAAVRHFHEADQTPGIHELTKPILKSAKDDLNSPEALRELDIALAKLDPTTKEDLPALLAVVDIVRYLLGIELIDRSDKVEKLVADREAARASKDWDRADAIRKELDAEGIAVNDTVAGPAWYKV